MKRAYQLIRIRSETAHDLRRLMGHTAKGSFDEMIAAMVRITKEQYDTLKETGWNEAQGGVSAET